MTGKARSPSSNNENDDTEDDINNAERIQQSNRLETESVGGGGSDGEGKVSSEATATNVL